ncbi:hypothetical protein SpCBS45565_g08400 [Spizellomyces sp. 'palustris']|nr:hypothetical protein SpCBS45565_g08400 [Spizellomyces sp. 'palustris']
MARARPFPSSKTLTGSDDAVFDSVNVEDDVVVNTPNPIAAGVTLRRFTTAGRDALNHVKRGTIVFNTDTNRVEVWTGTLWWSAAGKIVKEILSTTPLTQVYDTPNETTTVGLAFDALTLKVDDETGELYADFTGLVKDVAANTPLEATRSGDNIDISLKIDASTLEVDNDTLKVIRTANPLDVPLQYYEGTPGDSSSTRVRLAYDELTLKVDDDTNELYADFDGLVKNVTANNPLAVEREDDNIDIALKIDPITLKVDAETGELYSDFTGLVKTVTANNPLAVERTVDNIDIALNIDPATLAVDPTTHQLTVVRTATQADAPLEYYEVTPDDSSTTHIRLASRTPFTLDQDKLALNLHKSLKVDDDGKLAANTTNILKALGALRSTSGLTELSQLLPGDILDLGFSSLGDLFTFLGDTEITVIRLMANSDDFTQSSGTLNIRSHGNGRIPYFGVLDGLQSRPNFTYNETFNRLNVDDVKLAPRFSFSGLDQDDYAVTKGFVSQFIQASAGGGVDVSTEVNGRRELSVRRDASLQVDANNNVGVNVSAIVDGSTVRVVNNKIASGLNFQSTNGLKVRAGTTNDIQLDLKVQGGLEMVGTDTVRDILTANNGITRVGNEFQGAYTGSNGVTVNGANIQGAYTGSNGVTVTGGSIQGAYTGSSGVTVVGSSIQGSYTGTNGLIVAGGVIQGYIPGPGITITGNIISATGVQTLEDDDTNQTESNDVTTQADGLGGTVGAQGPVGAVAPIAGGALGPVAPVAGLVPALFGAAVAGAGWIAVWGYPHRRKQEEDENGTPIVDGGGNPVWETDGNGNYVLVPNAQVIITAGDYGDDTGGCTRLLFDTPPCAPTNLDEVEAQQAVNFDYLRRYITTKFPGLVTPYLQSTTASLVSYVDSGLASKQAVGDYATNTALTTGLATKQNTLTTSSNLVVNSVQGVFLIAVSAPNSYSQVSLGDGTSQAALFKNGTTRSADGGVKTLTLRNDDGALRLLATTNGTNQGLTVTSTSTVNSTDLYVNTTKKVATEEYVTTGLATRQPLNTTLTGLSGSTPTLTGNLVVTGTVSAEGGKQLATRDYVDAAIDTLNPDGLVTETELTTTLASYALESYVDTELATKQDVGDYATNTALTTGLATKQNVGDYATNTAVTNGLATKQPLNGNLTSLSGATPTVPSLTVTGGTTIQGAAMIGGDVAIDGVLSIAGGDPVASISYVDTAVAGRQPIGDYATNTALTTGLATKQNVGDYATNPTLTTGLATKQNVGDYATNTALTTGLATKQNVGDYAINTALTNGLATKQPLNGNLTSLSGATPTLPSLTVTGGTTIQGAATIGGDVAIDGVLTIVGGDPVASISYVDTAVAGRQPIGDYATNTALTTGLATKQNVGDYATNPTLTTGLATKQNVGDYATNTALTNGLATKQNTLTASSDIVVNTVQGVFLNGRSVANSYSQVSLGDGTSNAALYKNGAARSTDGGVNTLTLRNDTGMTRVLSQGSKGLTIAATTGNATFDGSVSITTDAFLSGNVNLGGYVAAQNGFYDNGIRMATQDWVTANGGTLKVQVFKQLTRSVGQLWGGTRTYTITRSGRVLITWAICLHGTTNGVGSLQIRQGTTADWFSQPAVFQSDYNLNTDINRTIHASYIVSGLTAGTTYYTACAMTNTTADTTTDVTLITLTELGP